MPLNTFTNDESPDQVFAELEKNGTVIIKNLLGRVAKRRQQNTALTMLARLRAKPFKQLGFRQRNAPSSALNFLNDF